MKFLDKAIRYWRVRVALNHRPERVNNVFDIGCDDGYLLRKIGPTTNRQDGVDPRLTGDSVSPTSELRKGSFPAAVREHQLCGSYDAIFALAVLEHFSESDLKQSAAVIAKMLSPTGRLIVTVPHPLVDTILEVLMFFRLIEGQALEEHHGFDPKTLPVIFSDALRLVKERRFQFGLNNVYVFERR